jgi:site-specific DNA-methyltransferase (adenine-specific)
MRAMPENSVDAIVTDPPYELTGKSGSGGFMGKAWDASGIAYSVEMWSEALRVLKPGGHLLAFGGTRTYHRMASAIEDAGFEIRDSIHWVYGSGFPKSLNVGKAIDKAAGAEREVVGTRVSGGMGSGRTSSHLPPSGIVGGANNQFKSGQAPVDVTAPATEEARQWEGWGTALKPAHEPVVVARKPLESTVAGNVLVWGTGGLNIDGCRVPTADRLGGGHSSNGQQMSDGWERPWMSDPEKVAANAERSRASVAKSEALGRWPANVVFDRTAGEALDQQSGERPAGAFPKSANVATGKHYEGGWGPVDNGERRQMDTGGASRFFTQADFGPDDWPFVYQAKPSRKERNAGLDGLPEQRPDQRTTTGMGTFEEKGVAKQSNHHPTVKPVALMRHLVRLVTPPGGTVLDPFAGSGTTLVAAVLEGFDAIGCEMTDEYLPIIEGRVEWAKQEASIRAPEQTTLL